MPNGVVVEIIGLNSSSLETGKHFLAGMGRIEEHSFMIGAEALGWHPETPSRALRILAVHHHLMLTENVEPIAGYLGGFGIAIDGPRILRLAAQHGVQLVVHGHKHRAFLWNSSVFELPEDTAKECLNRHIAILGGGSAGSTDRPNERNYFSVLRVDPDRLYYDLFQSEKGGAFKDIGTWSAKIDVSQSGHTTLLSWSKT